MYSPVDAVIEIAYIYKINIHSVLIFVLISLPLFSFIMQEVLHCLTFSVDIQVKYLL